MTILIAILVDPTFSKDEKDEMKGIASGSSTPLRYIKFANYIHSFAFALLKKTTFNHCSFVVNRGVEKHNFLVGKLTDLSYSHRSLFSQNNIVVIANRKDLAAKYISFSLPLLLIGDNIILQDGTYLGSNGGGYAAKTRYFYKKKSYISMNRLLALAAKNYQDCLQLIQAYSGKIIEFLNFIVVHRQGKKATIIEQNHLSPVYPVKNLAYRTNHPLKKDVTAHDYHKLFSNYGTKQRYCKIHELVQSSLDSTAKMQEVLSYHDETFDCFKGSLSNLGTSFGIIIDYTDRFVYLPHGNQDPITVYGSWSKFALDDLLAILNN